jgi:hypothetical protein
MKKKTEDFIHQTRSNYNRQSGDKTLAFVGVLIAVVVILTVVTLFIV